MGTCNAGAKKVGVHGQLPGGGLYVFFKRLVELILSPVTFVFVFDGPERPNFKRGHEVRHKKVWWTNLAIELIQHFGQVVHQVSLFTVDFLSLFFSHYLFAKAPGEAEAELARLNTEGYIDAVITSDGDTYVFGANCVLRTIYQKAKNHPDEYILYRSQTRQPYTRGGLILFALLTGGDYDTGLHRCGPGSAIALAKCGFGDQLIDAFEHLNGPDFDRFLIQWCCNIRAELHSNSRGHLERCQPKLAMDIPDTFPERRTLELYINPVTSWRIFGKVYFYRWSIL
ncbi:PIN domain-like protein [Pholiota conissans]|uniref:PIN domain-like protein n=1 Tax=Pholiota conissans TaxID=109636 RepID=A0A9P5YTW8_9AGAR|nr:PIN domain-like protein [Pholiota conissans]